MGTNIICTRALWSLFRGFPVTAATTRPRFDSTGVSCRVQTINLSHHGGDARRGAREGAPRGVEVDWVRARLERASADGGVERRAPRRYPNVRVRADGLANEARRRLDARALPMRARRVPRTRRSMRRCAACAFSSPRPFRPSPSSPASTPTPPPRRRPTVAPRRPRPPARRASSAPTSKATSRCTSRARTAPPRTSPSRRRGASSASTRPRTRARRRTSSSTRRRRRRSSSSTRARCTWR